VDAQGGRSRSRLGKRLIQEIKGELRASAATEPPVSAQHTCAYCGAAETTSGSVALKPCSRCTGPWCAAVGSTRLRRTGRAQGSQAHLRGPRYFTEGGRRDFPQLLPIANIATSGGGTRTRKRR